ncbi:hypothetical protein ACOMHN_040973 [Nucella lapillus]
MIVKFKLWQDKLLVVADKDARSNLRQKGVTASDDLTVCQREKLNHLIEQGRTGFYRGATLVTRGPQGNGGYNSYRGAATERRNSSYSAIRNVRHNDNSNNCESGDFSQYDSRLRNRNYGSYRQTPGYRDNKRYSNDANSNRGDPSSNRGHVNNTDNRKNVKEHRNGRHYDDLVVREVPSSNKPQSAQPRQTAGDKPPPPPCKTISSSSADAMPGATSSPVPSMLTRRGDKTAVEILARFQYSPRTRSDSVRTDPGTHGRHIESPATQQKEDASAARAASCDNLSTPQPRVG